MELMRLAPGEMSSLPVAQARMRKDLWPRSRLYFEPPNNPARVNIQRLKIRREEFSVAPCQNNKMAHLNILLLVCLRCQV